MNHELVMLRGLGYCRKAVKELGEQSLQMALKSYCTGCSHDTFRQMIKISNVTIQRDKFQNYLDMVEQALFNLPRTYRTLIVAVYVKQIPKSTLCLRYGVSLSTVYRKLTRARKSFKAKLESLGCTQQWFVENFGDTPWVKKLLSRNNGARIEL